jgi:hypothetical protein
MTALLQTIPIAAPVTGFVSSPLKLPAAPRNLVIDAEFTYGSGGTTVDAWVQTSIDGGKTWVDIAQFHFTTSSGSAIVNLSSLTPHTTQIVPTNGSLMANTVVDGSLGPQFQVLLTTTGTYAGGTALAIAVSTDQLS